jgi:hypothetical protein
MQYDEHYRQKEVISMDRQIRVAVYGESVIWAAIEAVLRKEPDIDVTRCQKAEDWRKLLEMDLDVILFDTTVSVPIEMLALLNQRPELTMIGLDFDSHKIVAHLAREDTVTTVEDLARVIRYKGAQI